MSVLSKAWRYGLAFVLCGAALAVALPLDSPSSCFFLAVIASSLYGGKGPGILSGLLSTLAFDYFFLPPKNDLWIEPSSYPRLAAFLGAVTAIVGLIEAKRRIDAQYRQVSADALAEARRSEARLRLIIDSIPVPAWSSRADGAADFINRRWLDYTGMPIEEALGWGWKVVCHPDDVDRTMEYWRSVLASHEDRELEARLRRFDGVYRWFLFRVSPLRDESGRVVQWYGTCIDIEDRKRAADAIRASELSFRLIVHSIPGLVATTTPKGEIELANQPLLDYTGLTFDQLKDWSYGGLVYEDDLPRVVARWKQSLETGCEYDVEYRMRRADGTYRWFHVRGLPLRDNQALVIRWYCVLTDIEDRKRTAEALQSSEQQLRLMVDSIPALIVIRTARGEVELANRQALDFTGHTLDRLKDWQEVVHPADRPGAIRRWQRGLQSGDPFETEIRLRRVDGVYRWFHTRSHPLRDNNGNILRWYSLLTDVEDRKHAEHALRASEHRLRLIAETIPALVWRTTPDGEIDYVNRRVLEYTGRPLEDFGHDGWLRLLHPDDVDSTRSIWRHNAQTGHSHQLAYRLRRADGEYRWFDVRGEPLRDGDGNVLQWYGICIDVEDSKRIEEALRNTQERLGVASQVATVGELAASIAHEVNQPLTAVVSNGNACLRWLSAQPPNLARAAEAAERIVRDGKDAGEVVRRIRALFKRAAHEELPLDLNDVIVEVLRLLRGETEKRRVAVETDLQPDLAPVPGDRVQLQQLIFNLLLNGIEAMDSVNDRPRKLFIRSRREGDDTVLVEIRDSGVGLRAGLTDPSTVFDAFFTTKENGMGMGLAICRSIVQAHNGRIWAAPGEGPGAMFCFTLPLSLCPVS